MRDRGDWVSVYRGRMFYPLDPQPEEIHITTIAFALSNIVRFGGHVRGYSVAEHCVHVSRLVPPEHALWGLLHDASEAYIGDMVRPLKRNMPEYRQVEARIMETVARRFDLPVDEPTCVREMDNQMLCTEHDLFFPTEEWHLPPRTIGPVDIQSWSAVRAEQEFLLRYHYLIQARSMERLAI